MLDGSDLAIVIPLWRRTAHIERVLVSALASTPEATVLFVASREDTAVVDVLIDVLADATRDIRPPSALFLPGVGGERGDYARKINAGYRATVSPFLFTGADDLEFHPGWYDAACALIRDAPCAYADTRMEHVRYVGHDGERALNWPGVVGTNDLCNDRTMNGTHSTHSLVARWYADCCAIIDNPGGIYYEGYTHEYCDDELVGFAMSRGAYAHALDAVVEHLHPLVGKSPDDVTYQHGRAHSRLNRRVFNSRRRMWERR